MAKQITKVTTGTWCVLFRFPRGAKGLGIRTKCYKMHRHVSLNKNVTGLDYKCCCPFLAGTHPALALTLGHWIAACLTEVEVPGIFSRLPQWKKQGHLPWTSLCDFILQPSSSVNKLVYQDQNGHVNEVLFVSPRWQVICAKWNSRELRKEPRKLYFCAEASALMSLGQS